MAPLRTLLAALTVAGTMGLGTSPIGATEHHFSPLVPGCTSSVLRLSVTATTTTSSAQLTGTVTNVSAHACAIAVGPTTPTLRITSPTGALLWTSCGGGDVSAPCPQYLAVKALSPKASYVEHARWGETEGHPPVRCPKGRYTLTFRLGAISTSTPLTVTG